MNIGVAAVLIFIVVLLHGCATPATSRSTPTPPIPSPAPAADPLFARMAGTWGAEPPSPYSCDQNPHTISFSPDFSEARFSTAAGVYKVLKIVKVQGNVLTMRAENETRKIAGGESAVWTLVLAGENRHYWRRTDWPDTTTTPPMIRCKPSSNPA